MLAKRHLPALKATRALIESEDERFICLAADEASYRAKQEGPDCDRNPYSDLICHIEGELAGEYTLDTYLAKQLNPEVADTFDGMDGHAQRRHMLNKRVMYLCRLAWLDKLIEEIEKC